MAGSPGPDWDYISDAPELIVFSAQSRGELGLNELKAQIAPPTCHRPNHVVLRLRRPAEGQIKAMSVNGHSHRAFDAERELVLLDPRPRIIEDESFY